MRAHTKLLARGLALVAACALAWPASAQDRGQRRQKPRRAQVAAQPVAPAQPNAEANTPATDAPSVPAPASDAAAASAATNAEPTPGPGATTTTASSPDGPQPTPEPEATAEKPTSAELSATRQELSSVMDALVSARTRVGLLGKSLFKTKVRVTLDNEAASDQTLGNVSLWLDGALVYRGDGSSLREEGAELFQGFAAPGPHVLTVEVEQRARENDEYRYSMRNGFRFFVLREHVTLLKIVLDDDSDVAEDFPDDQEGEYDVQIRLEIEARPLGGS